MRGIDNFPKQAILFLFLLFAFTLLPVYSQNNSEKTDDFIIKIAIISPGDEIYMWWGHIVLIVENTRRNNSRIFEWGAFTYPSDSFIKDFIQGNVRYMCTSSNLDMDLLTKMDWEIKAYTLNLDTNAKRAIINYAENSVLPENCYYDYQELRDNCSTRIRDIIDMGTRGQFKAAFSGGGGRYTTRQLLRRYTWFKPFSDWFLCFLMGQNFDKKITPWEGMFLPVEIPRNIINFTYTDDAGVERKLVSSVETVNSLKKQPPILSEAPAAWPFSLLAGVITGAFLFFIKVLGTKHRPAAMVVLGLSQVFLGFFLGVSGCILGFGLLFMNDFIRQNVNILFVNPLLLVIVPLGIISMVKNCKLTNPGQKSPLSDKILRIIWSFIFIAECLTLLLRIFPFLYQQNLGVLGLIAPVAFALSGFPEKIFRFCAGLYNRKVFPRSSA